MFRTCAFFYLVAAAASGQTLAPQEPAEMTTHDMPVAFHSKVNLVLIPVVVRDGKSHATGSLTKDDFHLFDMGKPQTITSFSVEALAGQTELAARTAEPVAASSTPNNQPAAPDRFVAFLFDDVHLNTDDLARTRDAAERQLNASFAPTDRAAIFSTSGRTNLGFTSDRAKLHQALFSLRPLPVARPSTMDCPYISYYQADLMENKNDGAAISAAAHEVLACASFAPGRGSPDAIPQGAAETRARAVADHALVAGYAETHVALSALRDVIGRMSILPGRRTVIVVSPGFLTLDDAQQEKNDLVDRAIRAKVIVSTLNARGMYTIVPGGDASQVAPRSAMGATYQAQYPLDSAAASENVLGEIADGTGGIYFHNSNDLDDGFNRVATPPEYVYVLGFSPQNLKMDGRFHALKITLANSAGFTVQARHGYYAPRRSTDPQELTQEEIEDLLFSDLKQQDIPLEMHTQFFKVSDASATLAVLSKVDLKRLTFHKEDGRSRDDLTLAYALFDGNGNVVTAFEKTVEMRLRDQTLDRRLASGLTIKNTFSDVKPGDYLVRMVVRDSAGQLMAAANETVQIP